MTQSNTRPFLMFAVSLCVTASEFVILQGLPEGKFAVTQGQVVSHELVQEELGGVGCRN